MGLDQMADHLAAGCGRDAETGISRNRFGRHFELADRSASPTVRNDEAAEMERKRALQILCYFERIGASFSPLLS
jgi:hypothetical protein